MRRTFGPLLVFGLLAGCTQASDDDLTVHRGPLGKADAAGSCLNLDGVTDFCGGQSAGPCWCDEQCVGFGDCCADAGLVCGVDLPPPDPTFCGGFAGFPCPDGETCVDDPSDSCDPQNGGADCGGICVPEEPLFCGGFAGLPCPDGMACIDDPEDDCDPNNGGADCGGICVPAPDTCSPVLCEIFCPFGFETDPETGCEVCSCADQPESSPCQDAGGSCHVGLLESCPDGTKASALSCGDVPIETTCCEPAGPPPPPAQDSCEDHCGGASADHSCYCDDLCVGFGDCCADVADACG